jgi:hypothetical protein
VALHGTVHVNASTIGTYDVQRLEDVTSADAVHRYRYRVHFDSWREPVTGELTHRYSDGAAVLLALVMSAAADRADQELPPPPPGRRRIGGATG